MTLTVSGYKSKKELKECIGKSLNYIETSMFGDEYKDNGTLTVAQRPYITKEPGREFFARVTIVNGKIAKVE
jgi:hypothetical protein